ncbi:hypothetical protein BKA80DRAFT_67921 [Phyllosticta citrichinensis]
MRDLRQRPADSQAGIAELKEALRAAEEAAAGKEVLEAQNKHLREHLHEMEEAVSGVNESKESRAFRVQSRLYHLEDQFVSEVTDCRSKMKRLQSEQMEKQTEKDFLKLMRLRAKNVKLEAILRELTEDARVTRDRRS